MATTPDPAPMTVYRCESCGALSLRQEEPFHKRGCYDTDPPVAVPVIPLADARRAVLAELTSEATVEAMAARKMPMGQAPGLLWEKRIRDEVRRDLSALAAHLACGET